MSDVAARYLFEELHIGLFSHSFSKLWFVSHHDTLRLFVKKIAFHSTQLLEFDGVDDYHECLRSLQRRPLMTYAEERKTRDEYLTGEVLDYHYDRYEYYRKDREFWRNTEDMCFQRCISKLACLESVYLPQSVLDACTDLTLRGLISSETLLTEVHHQYRDLDLIYDELEYHRGVRELAILLEGLSMRPCGTIVPIKQLKFHVAGFEFFNQQTSVRVDPSQLGKRIPERFGNMRPAFRVLQSLDCTMDRRYGYNQERPDVITEGLAFFLAEAKQLTSLTLKIFEIDDEIKFPPKGPNCDLLDFLPTGRLWPKIRHLSLGIATSETHLMRLLGDHSESLKSLVLRQCRMVDHKGSWRPFLTRLPELVSLENVELDGLWDAEFSDAPRTTQSSKEGYLFAPQWGEARGRRSPSPRRRAFEEYILRGGPLPSFDQATYPAYKENQ